MSIPEKEQEEEDNQPLLFLNWIPPIDFRWDLVERIRSSWMTWYGPLRKLIAIECGWTTDLVEESNAQKYWNEIMVRQKNFTYMVIVVLLLFLVLFGWFIIGILFGSSDTFTAGFESRKISCINKFEAFTTKPCGTYILQDGHNHFCMQQQTERGIIMMHFGDVLMLSRDNKVVPVWETDPHTKKRSKKYYSKTVAFHYTDRTNTRRVYRTDSEDQNLSFCIQHWYAKLMKT